MNSITSDFSSNRREPAPHRFQTRLNLSTADYQLLPISWMERDALRLATDWTCILVESWLIFCVRCLRFRHLLNAKSNETMKVKRRKVYCQGVKRYLRQQSPSRVKPRTFSAVRAGSIADPTSTSIYRGRKQSG